MSENRDFKGVWIPKEIWIDKKLNVQEKIILAGILDFDNDEQGCSKSNECLAEICQCSVSKMSKAISKLIKLEYIYCSKFDGRQRFLKEKK